MYKNIISFKRLQHLLCSNSDYQIRYLDETRSNGSETVIILKRELYQPTFSTFIEMIEIQQNYMQHYSPL